MKHALVFTGFAAAILLLLPASAQARYTDGMNLYEYVGSNPAANNDPTGLMVVPTQIRTPEYAVKRTKEYEDKRKKAINSPAWFTWFSTTAMASRSKQANMKVLWGLGQHTFWPGTTSTGRNAFIYTCRYGWLDLGHFFTTAHYAYKKGGYQGVSYAWKKGIDMEILQDFCRKTSGGLTGDMANSAWTPEDLPSNSAGSYFGFRIWSYDQPKIKAFEQRRRANKKITYVKLTSIADQFKQFLTNVQAVKHDEDGTVRKTLIEDVKGWVDSSGWVLDSVREHGKSVLSSYNWQKTRTPFRCFCNPDGTAKKKYRWR